MNTQSLAALANAARQAGQCNVAAANVRGSSSGLLAAKQVTGSRNNHIATAVTGINTLDNGIRTQVQVHTSRAGLNGQGTARRQTRGEAIARVTDLATGVKGQMPGIDAAVRHIDDIATSRQRSRAARVIQTTAHIQVVECGRFNQPCRVSDKSNLERIIGLDRMANSDRCVERETIVPLRVVLTGAIAAGVLATGLEAPVTTGSQAFTATVVVDVETFEVAQRTTDILLIHALRSVPVNHVSGADIPGIIRLP